MAERGAQPGNTNAAKARVWTQAIERVFEKRSSLVDRNAELDLLAERLVDLAKAGDMIALKEIGDRLEGKPKQAIEAELTGNLTVNVLRFADSQPPE